jgi:hypothetical protein
MSSRTESDRQGVSESESQRSREILRKLARAAAREEQTLSDQSINTLGGPTLSFSQTTRRPPHVTMRRAATTESSRPTTQSTDTAQWDFSEVDFATDNHRAPSPNHYSEESEEADILESAETDIPQQPPPRSAKKLFYAVAVGRSIGIFSTWEETESNISGFPQAKHKSFRSFEDAQEWLERTMAAQSSEFARLSDYNMQLRKSQSELARAHHRSEEVHNTPARFGRDNAADLFEQRHNTTGLGSSPISNVDSDGVRNSHYSFRSQYSAAPAIGLSGSNTTGRAQQQEWVWRMLQNVGEETRRDLPAYMPCVDSAFQSELSECDLDFVIRPLSQGELERCIEACVQQMIQTAEVKVQACQLGPQGVGTRLADISKLLREVIVYAPEEEEDQARMMKAIADQLDRVTQTHDQPSRGVEDEGPTLHYLQAALINMLQLIMVRRKCLVQAQHLDSVIANIWRVGLPARCIQDLKTHEGDSVREAKSAVRRNSSRAVHRAFQFLLDLSTERHRVVNGWSTDTSTGLYAEEEDEVDDEDGEDELSVGTISTVSVSPARRKKMTTAIALARKGKGKEFNGSEEKQVSEVLMLGKKMSYLKMCEAVATHGMEDWVNRQVEEQVQSWIIGQRHGWSEEIRVRIAEFSVCSWLWDSKLLSGGKSELERFDFEGRSHSIAFREMWTMVENISQQYFWPITYFCQQLVLGATLTGEALRTFKVAKKSDAVLGRQAPLVGDIVASLVWLYQIRIRMYLMLGKPIDGGVLNTWIELVRWNGTTALSSFETYTELKELVVQKPAATATMLVEEMQRQTRLTEVGRAFMVKVTGGLKTAEAMKASQGGSFILNWDTLQAIVDRVHQENLIEEQTIKCADTRAGRVRNSTSPAFVGALLVDNMIEASGRRVERGSSPVGSREGDRQGRGQERYQSPQGDRSRSQSPQSDRPQYDQPPNRDRYRGYGRGDYRRGEDTRGRGGQGRYDSTPWRSTIHDECQSCGTKHFEDVGARCPWRPVDATGQLVNKEWNGWDVKWWVSKSHGSRTAMMFRLREINPKHPAAMTKDMYEQFVALVDR